MLFGVSYCPNGLPGRLKVDRGVGSVGMDGKNPSCLVQHKHRRNAGYCTSILAPDHVRPCHQGNKIWVQTSIFENLENYCDKQSSWSVQRGIVGGIKVQLFRHQALRIALS